MWKFISFVSISSPLFWPRFLFELTPTCLHTPKRIVKDTKQTVQENVSPLQQLANPAWSLDSVRIYYMTECGNYMTRLYNSSNQPVSCTVAAVAPSWRKFYDFYSQPRNGYHILFIWFLFYASYTIILTVKLDLNLHLFISHVAYSTYIWRSIYKNWMHFFAIKLGKLETINFSFVFISLMLCSEGEVLSPSIEHIYE